MLLTERQMRAAVKMAAGWLDVVWPVEELGPWYERINTASFSLLDPCWCVCGQLGQAVAAHEGYEVGLDGYIEVLRNEGYVSGYELMTGDPEDVDDEERRLADLFRKRFGLNPIGPLEELNAIVPDHLDAAFLPQPGGNAAWLEEILRRRRDAAT